MCAGCRWHLVHVLLARALSPRFTLLDCFSLLLFPPPLVLALLDCFRVCALCCLFSRALWCVSSGLVLAPLASLVILFFPFFLLSLCVCAFVSFPFFSFTDASSSPFFLFSSLFFHLFPPLFLLPLSFSPLRSFFVSLFMPPCFLYLFFSFSPFSSIPLFSPVVSISSSSSSRRR